MDIYEYYQSQQEKEAALFLEINNTMREIGIVYARRREEAYRRWIESPEEDASHEHL